MATFKAGDTVKATTTGVIGDILEVDGDTAYIETPSGVEMEYCVRFLEPYVSYAEEQANKLAAHEATATAIVAAFGTDIMAVGEAYFDTTLSTLQQILEQKDLGWNSLTSEQQLNYIGVFFGLKPDMFFKSYGNGKIHLMVKHITDIIAIAAKNGGDILAAKAEVMMDFMVNSIHGDLKE